MSEIDIDSLSEDELYALSGRIYDRITMLERKRERSALSRYGSGLRIIVAAPGYGQMIGTTAFFLSKECAFLCGSEQ
ncbi:hypothetical protein [Brucella sp. NBRC 12950]|uniref:hypothetical protein n=1 Tax=Brucella sp. NBRC 12950 TaxID=2994518 RepID=UPI0024A5002A|nr:hypothetical protein [Brucella sp. NBRC 12950]GLU28020.1 hypothetical protein Brsp01_32530 [Brucella sp. NBRC 12950]